MEINKEILISAIRGTDGPNYNVMTKFENMGLGKYVGGFHDRFVWNSVKSFEHLTEEQLKATLSSLKSQYQEK